jgi:hypothetical protein
MSVISPQSSVSFPYGEGPTDFPSSGTAALRPLLRAPDFFTKAGAARTENERSVGEFCFLFLPAGCTEIFSPARRNELK